MSAIRVLVAIPQQMLRNALLETIACETDFVVVGEATTPMELLMGVGRYQADAVVLSTEDPQTVPDFCTHLFAEYPQLLVVALSHTDNSAFAYRKELVKRELTLRSIDDILRALRDADVEYWAPGSNGSGP